MKRLIATAALLVSMLTASLAFADFKGPAITGELKRDLKARVEKTNGWRTTVSGKAGDKMRPFRASSIRPLTLSGGGTVHVGFMVTGRFSTTSGRTYVDGIAAPRSK